MWTLSLYEMDPGVPKPILSNIKHNEFLHFDISPFSKECTNALIVPSQDTNQPYSDTNCVEELILQNPPTKNCQIYLVL